MTQQASDPFSPERLKALITTQMPFGRYRGCPLIDLPEPYVVWFYQQGFPQGKLGELLALTYEIKLNGLEKLLNPLRNQSKLSP